MCTCDDVPNMRGDNVGSTALLLLLILITTVNYMYLFYFYEYNSFKAIKSFRHLLLLLLLLEGVKFCEADTL